MATTQENAAEDSQRIIAELRRERDAALAREAALAEVMQVINRSPGDPGPVFDAILEKAHKLCGAAIGALQLYDGTYLRAVASHGFPEDHAALIRRPYRPTSNHEGLIRGDRFFHVPDMRTLTTAPGEDVARSTIEGTGVRTCLVVPLRKDGDFLGYISAFRLEIRPFGETEIALLESFAAQAVIAMENARLITETREALEQQTATAEVLQVINASPGNLEPVFQAIVEKAHDLCDAAHGSLQLWDGELFRGHAMRGFSEPMMERLRQGYSPWPNMPCVRIVEGADVVHCDDLAEVDNPTAHYGVEFGGVRTILYVALRKDGVLLGQIVATRREVRSFSDKQISLVRAFATQAVIAMENARLIDEQREALQQQTATAEVLQAINASPGNLTPVFDTMLEKAMRLCEAMFGSLYTYDGEQVRSVAQRGGTPAYAAYRVENPPRNIAGGFIPRLLGTKCPVHILDVMQEGLYQAGDPNMRAMVHLGGVRTILIVPLLKDGDLRGFVSIYRQEVRAFSGKQIALLENFAAQAVIAMENARLITEQREALEQQTATAEVLRVINASPGNLPPVFDAMLEKALRLCEAAFGSLALFDGDTYRYVANKFLPGFALELVRGALPIDPGNSIGRIARGESPVHIEDITTDTTGPDAGPRRRAMMEAGVRTALWVALRKDQEILGCFVTFRREVRPFSDKQIALLENFAAQAVIAIENARLLQELRARTDELAQRQQELRLTFENMGDGVAMFDQELRLVAWNTRFQEMFAVPDDLLQQRLVYADYIRYLARRGDYGPDVDIEEQVRRISANMGQYRVTERTRPDGRVIEIRNNPVEGGGFVLMFSDITERKRNEAEIAAARDAAQEAARTIEAAFQELKIAQANLIQAEKMASLGQLTAGIAHEIKNPLNFVNNFASLSVDLLAELKEAAAPGFAALTEEQRAEIDDVSAMLTSNLQKITEHGKRADGIVKAMLEHSRGASGERREVDINALADEALNLAYHGARAQDQSFNITLERDFGDGIAPIELNPQDITRVLLNLFGNGFYAANRRARDGAAPGFSPTLKLTTRDLGRAVEIRVRDNGTGIPEDIRDKLFQPFFTTKPTGEGTGLGLSITYDIVTKQHGGSIAVDSEVDAFTEFVVTLPRAMIAGEGARP